MAVSTSFTGLVLAQAADPESSAIKRMGGVGGCWSRYRDMTAMRYVLRASRFAKVKSQRELRLGEKLGGRRVQQG